MLSSALTNGLEATTLEGSKLKFDLTNGVKARSRGWLVRRGVRARALADPRDAAAR